MTPSCFIAPAQDAVADWRPTLETKDVGRLFGLRASLANPKGKRLVFRQPTFELDPPYRYSNSFVIRLPHGRGVLVGWWRKSPAESLSDHFSLALGANRDDLILHTPDPGPRKAECTATVPWEDMTADQHKEASSRSMVVEYAGESYNPGERLDSEPL